MGDALVAERVWNHFATVVSPTLALTPFGQRAVSTQPAISLLFSANVAVRSNGNRAALFLKKSKAIHPISADEFRPTEAFMDNPVEDSYATGHGHMGRIHPKGGAPGPYAAINTGVLSGPQADCSAEIAALLDLLASRLANEIKSAPVQAYRNFNSASDAAAGALLTAHAESIATASKGFWHYLSSGGMRDDMISGTSSAMEYVFDGHFSRDALGAYDKAVSATTNALEYTLDGGLVEDASAFFDTLQNMDYGELMEACKAWLMEMLGTLGCSLRDLLAQMAADKRPVATQLGEMHGTMKAIAAEVAVVAVADAFVTRGALSAAGRVGMLAARSGKAIQGLGERLGRVVNNARNRTKTPDAPAREPVTPPPRPPASQAARTDTPDTPDDPNKGANQGPANGDADVPCLSCALPRS